MAAGSVCARGPIRQIPLPKERGPGARDRERHQPRSLLRGVAGSIPAGSGSQRLRSGSGAGEVFPLKHVWFKRQDQSAKLGSSLYPKGAFVPGVMHFKSHATGQP